MTEYQQLQTVKIVVHGPFRCGQSTFINTISEIDTHGTTSEKTVAMDFGCITIEPDVLACYLFGTPRSRRYDFVYEILAEGLLGNIVMLDSTAPETFHDVRSIVYAVQSYVDGPLVIVANFRDQPHALAPEDIQFFLYTSVPVVPCIAYSLSSVKRVLLALCHEALHYANY
ncbi:MAG: GTP-binding protein [Chloroflexota bacterium]